MSNTNGRSDLDVFDALAPKAQSPSALAPDGPSLPASAPSASVPKPPMPTSRASSASAAALLRGRSQPSVPPPPPSYGMPSAPSRPDAMALLAGSGRAAGAMPRLPSNPPPSRLTPPAPVPQTAAPMPPPPAPVRPIEAAGAEQTPIEEALVVDAEPLVFDGEGAEQAVPAEAGSSDALPWAAPMQPDALGEAPHPEVSASQPPLDAASLAPLPPLTPPPSRPRSIPPVSAPIPAAGPPGAVAQSRPVIPSLAPTTMASDADATLRLARAAAPHRRLKIAAAVGALVAAGSIAGAVLLMMPGKASLRVYVAGPQGQEVGQVDVFVDDNKVCSSSPCTVGPLEPGIHDVYAEAVGHARTATKGVEIKGGKDEKLAIDLLDPSTGFRVASRQTGVALEVDGKQVGLLPQALTALTPGEHRLRFVGSDRYEPLAKTITVLPNQVEDLGNIELSVVKGRATFELATTSVRMRLVSAEGDARELDEGMFEDRRLSVDLDTSKSWKLQACSRGYELLELPLSFADGEAEKTFKVELARSAAGARSQLESWCVEAKEGAARGASPASPTPAAAGGGGTLNINSVPVSAAVLLDGKPIGRTPMSGVKVSAGNHTLVFIHPDKGRKSASVSVGAGQSKGVGVRF